MVNLFAISSLIKLYLGHDNLHSYMHVMSAAKCSPVPGGSDFTNHYTLDNGNMCARFVIGASWRLRSLMLTLKATRKLWWKTIYYDGEIVINLFCDMQLCTCRYRCSFASDTVNMCEGNRKSRLLPKCKLLPHALASLSMSWTRIFKLQIVRTDKSISPFLQQQALNHDMQLDFPNARNLVKPDFNPPMDQYSVDDRSSAYQTLPFGATFSRRGRGRRPSNLSGRSFPCLTCGKEFATNWGLTKHKATHTGNYTYYCQLCKKGFMEQRMLNVHMDSHRKKLESANLLWGAMFMLYY